MGININDIFPECEVKTRTLDDYSEVVLCFDHKSSGRLIARMPRLNPYEIGYSWGEDVTIEFVPGERQFDASITELIERLQLFIAELHVAARDRDDPGADEAKWLKGE
jgi:hypothetical protein